MKNVYRALPWAVLVIVVVGIALIAPRSHPAWLPRVALALMGFGGACSIVLAIIGYLSHRLTPAAAVGTLLIGLGFILFGSQWVPGVTSGHVLAMGGIALGIVGMMLQVKGMKSATR